MRRSLLAMMLLGLVAGATGQARADTIGLDITGGNNFIPSGDGTDETLGWSFTTGTTLTVSGLGFWDEADHTLGFSHQVGLWDSSQNLLASTTITAASTPVASTGPGQWLFNTIGSVTLGPGTYFLGATYLSTDSVDLYREFTSATTIPGVTFDTAQFNQGSGLLFPVFTSPFNAGYFGPNFEVSAVPEPSSLGLLGLASSLGGVAWRRRRRPAA